MKKKLVIANWKMNLNVAQSLSLLARIDKNLDRTDDVEVVLAPPAIALQPLSQEIKQNKFLLAAQNAYFKDEGAYTGEISFTQLRGLVDYVIVGHSERRIYFGEDDKMVRDKVQSALRNGISPIICVGENTDQRNTGQTQRVLHDQLTGALGNVTSQEIEHIVIAYEPVWAISTFEGQVAKPEDVKKAFNYILEQIFELFGNQAAKTVRLIYGGSVDDSTVSGYLNAGGCNGVLVGGASLNPEKFSNIVKTAEQQGQQ